MTWTPADGWSAGASVLHVGDRVDQYDTSTAPPTSYVDPAYTLVDLFGTVRLNETFGLFGRVENLFNVHYEPELGYGAPGRSTFVGLRATY